MALPYPFSVPYITGALAVLVVMAVMATTGPEDERRAWTFTIAWCAVAYILMMVVYL